MLDDGRDSQVLDRIIKSAVLEVFRARVKPELLGPIVVVVRGRLGRAHRRGRARRPTTRSWSTSIDGLKPLLAKLGVGESPAACASGIEFVLEGLHLTKRLEQGRARRPGHVSRPRLTVA